MAQRVILVHGINTDGKGNTDVLADALERRGLDVVRFKYKPVRFWNARWRVDDVARSVRNYIEPGDCAVGHSFGCLTLFEAMRQGAEFEAVVYFGAAMDKRVTFPFHGMHRLLNVANPYDGALTLGNWLRFRHPFGLLGRDGYAGPPDRRVRHLQSADYAGPHNHTAPYFDPAFVEQWAQRVYEFVV